MLVVSMTTSDGSITLVTDIGVFLALQPVLRWRHDSEDCVVLLRAQDSMLSGFGRTALRHASNSVTFRRTPSRSNSRRGQTRH